MTEQEFRLKADHALEALQRALLPLADAEDFEVEPAERRAAGDLRGAVPRQIRRQSKRAGAADLAVGDVAELQAGVGGRRRGFVLDGETLVPLVERLARQDRL